MSINPRISNIASIQMATVAQKRLARQRRDEVLAIARALPRGTIKVKDVKSLYRDNKNPEFWLRELNKASLVSLRTNRRSAMKALTRDISTTQARRNKLIEQIKNARRITGVNYRDKIPNVVTQAKFKQLSKRFRERIRKYLRKNNIDISGAEYLQRLNEYSRRIEDAYSQRIQDEIEFSRDSPIRISDINVNMQSITLDRTVYNMSIPNSEVGLIYSMTRRVITRGLVGGIKGGVRIKFARTENPQVLVTLIFKSIKDNKPVGTKVATVSARKSDINEALLAKIEGFSDENNTSDGQDYVWILDRIKVSIVKERAGGVTGTKYTKNYTPNDKRGVTYILPSGNAEDNNCFFQSVKDLIYFPTNRRNDGIRPTRVSCNKIRKHFKLDEDSMIPITIAYQIFLKYRRPNIPDIFILDELTNLCQGDPNAEIKIALMSDPKYINHYARKTGGICPHCKIVWQTKHVCNPERVRFRNNLKGLPEVLRAPRKFLGKLRMHNMVHYDIETTRKPMCGDPRLRKDSDPQLHTPCCIGAIHYVETNRFDFKPSSIPKERVQAHFEAVKAKPAQERRELNGKCLRLKKDAVKEKPECYVWYKREYVVFTGSNCMRDFVEFLDNKTAESTHDIFINAYNSSRFDSLLVFQEYQKQNRAPCTPPCLNGSEVIQFKFRNKKENGTITTFDLYKHMVGHSLSRACKALQCEMSKGEIEFDDRFNYPWEQMDESLHREILCYLERDVRCLAELYEKHNTGMFNTFGVNVYERLTLGSLSYDLWRKEITTGGNIHMQLPTKQQDDDFRKAVIGGRCYPTRRSFVHPKYQEIMDNKVDFCDIREDSAIATDCNSLYPAVMSKYQYPVGNINEAVEDEFYPQYMGIYLIEFIAPHDLQHSIVGKKCKGKLYWNLKEGKHWHTTVAIEDMVKNGYKITKYHRGWYWKETAPVFRNYINMLYEMRNKNRDNPLKNLLCKLLMNALYGKNLEKCHYGTTEIVKDNNEFWKFIAKFHVTSHHQIHDVWYVNGIPKSDDDNNKCCKRASHLGAFILDYSKRMMMEFMQKMNPNFKHEDRLVRAKHDFFYSDTDSIHLLVKDLDKSGVQLHNRELGRLSNDHGEDSYIIRGIWISPKLYFEEVARPADNEVGYEIIEVLKGKGVRNLTKEDFLKMDAGDSVEKMEDFKIGRIGRNKTKRQEECNVPAFSIFHFRKENPAHHRYLTREVNKQMWYGRQFFDENGRNDPYGVYSSPWIKD